MKNLYSFENGHILTKKIDHEIEKKIDNKYNIKPDTKEEIIDIQKIRKRKKVQKIGRAHV